MFQGWPEGGRGGACSAPPTDEYGFADRKSVRVGLVGGWIACMAAE